MRFEEREGGIRAGDGHVIAEWTARATHPDTGQALEWDGMDLIQIVDGRICRNAVYSSAHAARTPDPG
jgi:ketosteroid isomerase-like protein